MRRQWEANHCARNQKNVKTNNASEVRQRLNEQKKPRIKTATGIRGKDGKVYMDHTDRLRITTEHLQNGFPTAPRTEERIIPTELWILRE